MTNLNTAFDVAEKYLDIPKMLDAEGKLAGCQISETMTWKAEHLLCWSTNVCSLFLSRG